MSDEDRGTGRTTEQMKAAPKGSLFVWCNEHRAYPKALALELGRDDLVITTPARLVYMSGGGYPAVVIDHFASLTERQQSAAQHLGRQS